MKKDNVIQRPSMLKTQVAKRRTKINKGRRALADDSRGQQPRSKNWRTYIELFKEFSTDLLHARMTASTEYCDKSTIRVYDFFNEELTESEQSFAKTTYLYVKPELYAHALKHERRRETITSEEYLRAVKHEEERGRLSPSYCERARQAEAKRLKKAQRRGRKRKGYAVLSNAINDASQL